MLEFRIAGLLNLLFFAFRNFNKQAAITDKTQDTHTAIKCAFIILTLRLTFSFVLMFSPSVLKSFLISTGH